MTATNEQETTLTAVRNDPWVYVWTNDLRMVRRLAKRGYEPLETPKEGEWGGHYKLPSADFDPLSGFKRKSRPLTDDERSAAAERLARYRAEKAAQEADEVAGVTTVPGDAVSSVAPSAGKADAENAAGSEAVAA